MKPCPFCGLYGGFHTDEQTFGIDDDGFAIYPGHRQVRMTMSPLRFLPKKGKKQK